MRTGRADQMREAIATREVITKGGPLQVTMSTGLLRSADWPSRTADSCLHEVDAALYAAKAAGRNCVRVAVPAQTKTIISVEPAEKVHERQ